MGGLGIASATHIAPAAYAGSMAQVAHRLVRYYPNLMEKVEQLKSKKMEVDEKQPKQGRKQQPKKNPNDSIPAYIPPQYAEASHRALDWALDQIEHQSIGAFSTLDVHGSGPLHRNPTDFLARFISAPEQANELQSAIYEGVLKRRFEQLFASLPEEGKARLHSASGPQAGRAFTAIPKSDELSMSNRQFHLAVSHRLNLPYGRHVHVSACRKCNRDPNTNEHSHTCPAFRRTAALSAHTNIQTIWSNAVKTNGGHATLEVQLTDKKVADVHIVMHDESIMGDVSITCPAAASYRHGASQKKLNAAHTRELAKNKKYLAVCNRIGARFTPLVMESYGAMPRSVVSLARRIAEYGRNLSVRNALTANDILNQLAVALQRGNAFLISSAFIYAFAGVS